MFVGAFFCQILNMTIFYWYLIEIGGDQFSSVFCFVHSKGNFCKSSKINICFSIVEIVVKMGQCFFLQKLSQKKQIIFPCKLFGQGNINYNNFDNIIWTLPIGLYYWYIKYIILLQDWEGWKNVIGEHIPCLDAELGV